MMDRKVMFLLVAGMLTAPAAMAQQQSGPLTAYGMVGKLPAISICQDGAKYKLVNSNLRMKDDPKGGIDASKFLGRWVRVEGSFQRGLISPSCDKLVLKKITASTEYLEEKGSNPTPGGMINFTFFGQIGSLHALLMAEGPPLKTLIPLGPLGLLTLSPKKPIFNLTGVSIPVAGSSPIKLPIPNDPALKGVDLTFQSAATVFKPNLAAYLLNPQLIQIK